MEKVNIAQAQAELAKMAGFAKAFADAQIVLNALANAEQVGRELADANDKARAELGAAKDDIAAAKTEAEKARASARSAIKNAEVKADKLVAEAEEKAADTSRRVEAEGAEADKSLAAKRDELANLKQAVDESSAELLALETKIAGAKDAVAKLLAG